MADINLELIDFGRSLQEGMISRYHPSKPKVPHRREELLDHLYVLGFNFMGTAVVKTGMDSTLFFYMLSLLSAFGITEQDQVFFHTKSSLRRHVFSISHDYVGGFIQKCEGFPKEQSSCLAAKPVDPLSLSFRMGPWKRHSH
jgi:hypothetical protein